MAKKLDAKWSSGWFASSVRKNVYVELQRHHEREEEWRNQAALRIARSLQLPVLATNGVRYATAYDREILDLFTAIRNHTNLIMPAGFCRSTTSDISAQPQEMAACFEISQEPSRTQLNFIATAV